MFAISVSITEGEGVVVTTCIEQYLTNLNLPFLYFSCGLPFLAYFFTLVKSMVVPAPHDHLIIAYLEPSILSVSLREVS